MTVNQAANRIRTQSGETLAEEFSATLQTLIHSGDCMDLVLTYAVKDAPVPNLPLPSGVSRSHMKAMGSGLGCMAMGIMIGKMIERENRPKDKE